MGAFGWRAATRPARRTTRLRRRRTGRIGRTSRRRRSSGFRRPPRDHRSRLTRRRHNDRRRSHRRSSHRRSSHRRSSHRRSSHRRSSHRRGSHRRGSHRRGNHRRSSHRRGNHRRSSHRRGNHRRAARVRRRHRPHHRSRRRRHGLKPPLHRLHRHGVQIAGDQHRRRIVEPHRRQTTLGFAFDRDARSVPYMLVQQFRGRESRTLVPRLPEHPLHQTRAHHRVRKADGGRPGKRRKQVFDESIGRQFNHEGGHGGVRRGHPRNMGTVRHTRSASGHSSTPVRSRSGHGSRARSHRGTSPRRVSGSLRPPTAPRRPHRHLPARARAPHARGRRGERRARSGPPSATSTARGTGGDVDLPYSGQY